MTAEQVTVRRGLPSDWATVARLHALSWRSAYRGIYPDSYLDEDVFEERRGYWRKALAAWDAERDAVFIAEDEAGQPVGFACIRRSADPAGPLLDNLHIRPDRRGGGVGRKLIGAAAAWLVDQEPEAPLQLLVWAANAPARRFYASLGGLEVAQVRGALPGGGTAPEIRMRWPRAAALLS